MKLLKTGIAAAIAATAMFSATGASAAVITNYTLDGATATFGNPSVNTAGSFSDTLTFTTPSPYNNVSAILNSTFNTGNPATNLNFAVNGVTLTNTLGSFTFNVANGIFDQASRESIPLVAGGTNTLLISGTSGGDASYSGTLSFATVAAVPEPGTWALMLLGFGAVGFSMRRSRRSAGALMQLG